MPDIASAYKSRMKVADLSSKEEIAIFEKAKNQVEETGIQLRNSLEVVELQMTEPTLDDTMPDVERLTRALRKFMNLKRIRVPYAVLRKLPDVLRASKFSVKCVVRVTAIRGLEILQQGTAKIMLSLIQAQQKAEELLLEQDEAPAPSDED